MSADEFWRDDPQLFVSYRTSFLNKKEREISELDYKCWLQGLYNHNGNAILFGSLKQFLSNTLAGIFKGKKDTTKISDYPSKPYTELEKDMKKEELEQKRKNRYKEYENSLMYYGTMKQRYLDEMNKKKGE